VGAIEDTKGDADCVPSWKARKPWKPWAGVTSDVVRVLRCRWNRALAENC
jgi:hypothetical protein